MKINKLAYAVALINLPFSCVAMEVVNNSNETIELHDSFYLQGASDPYKTHLSGDGNQLLYFSKCYQDICDFSKNFGLVKDLKNKNNIEPSFISNSISSDYFQYKAISENGQYIIGNKYNAVNGKYHAFSYDKENKTETKLYHDKYKDDISVFAISANGNTIIGNVNTDNGFIHAFRYHKGDNAIKSLGTLKKDNSGHSFSQVVSADGNVVAGISDTDNGMKHVFRHHKGDDKIKDIGAWYHGFMSNTTVGVTDISGNGDVIIGHYFQHGTYGHGMQVNSFYHHKDNDKIVTIPTSNTHFSHDNNTKDSIFAKRISKDGRVIIGERTPLFGKKQAFRFYWQDNKFVNLGKYSDGNGSRAIDISADGRIVIGNEIQRYSESAFVHFEGEEDIIRLTGSRNTNNTTALQISDDGSTILGISWRYRVPHYTLWKVSINENHASSLSAENLTLADDSIEGDLALNNKSVTHDIAHNDSKKESVVGYQKHSQPQNSFKKESVVTNTENSRLVVSKPVDIYNSQIAMQATAAKAYHVLDINQSSLFKLNSSRCDINNSNYCIGIYSDYTKLLRNNRIATGLTTAFVLADSNWSIGANIDFSPYSKLEKGYQITRSVRPNVGVFAQYHDASDKTGLDISLSGALIEQKVEISREQLENTEQGKGQSKITGYLAGLNAGYGIELGTLSYLTPQLDIKYYSVQRAAYTESSGANFKANYTKLGFKRMDLAASLHLSHKINSLFSIEGRGGMNIKLHESHHQFIGYIEAIDAQSYDNKINHQRLLPYANLDLITSISTNSSIKTSMGWMKTVYNNNSLSAGLMYSYHW